MKDQAEITGISVSAKRGDLAVLGMANPLVSRGLADLMPSSSNAAMRKLLRSKQASVLAERGFHCFSKGDYDAAFKDFDEAIRLDPNHAKVYVGRGCAGLGKGDYEKAFKDFGEAIRLDPRLAIAYQFRGLTWRKKGDCDKAIKDYDEAIRLGERDATVYRLRGRAWSKKKDCDRAINDFDEAIRLDPSNRLAFHFRGLTRYAQRQYDKAAKDFKQAVRLFDEAIRVGPKNARVYSSFAYLLATCPEETIRDGRRAIELAKTACKLGSTHGDWGLDTLAAAYAEASHFEEAIRCQTQVLALRSERGLNVKESLHRLELYKQKRPFREES
jgi:tetratricopeptide (TPR) repeat protein